MEARAPVRAPRLSSVGAKLAGATVALIAMSTAGINLRLSEYQRESLLHAKELSATAVTQLFADSCAAAVVFQDPTDLRETLRTLGRNEEIEYAAVWAVDDKGRVAGRLAELRRGPPETGTGVPSALVLRRERERVVLVSPIHDPRGRVVGVQATAFSLAHENAAIARLKRTALLTSTAVATGLTILLMAMARLVVVGPLAKLVGAAKRLEEGRNAEIDVSSDDEVGRLARALRTMAGAIQTREERINTRNRDMRLVLDNVGQGLVTLDMSGAMLEERSRVVDEWFGRVDGSPKLWEYLGRLDARFRDNFEVGWSAVVDQFLPVELCLHQLASVVQHDGRTFKLDYRPIFRGEVLDKTVVVISDITMRLERERSEQRQRETMSIHRRLVADRPAFEQFYAEASALVEAIADTTRVDLLIIKRQVHTLKGNCGLFGIESVAGLCHEIEDRLEDSPVLTDEDRALLRAAWAVTAETHAELIGAGAEDSITVTREDYDRLRVNMHFAGASQALLAEINAWEFEPVANRFAIIREQIQELARRLGKAPVDVVWEPTRLRLPPEKWRPFWSAFAHVIRNTVDHGVETVDARSAAGKPACATVPLSISHDRDQVQVSVEDDGAGIDWQAIAAKAAARGLPYATRRDLEEALFTDGLSSRGEAPGTSGRGVGLGAARASLGTLGGRLELTDRVGPGTMVRCWLPAAMLVTADQIADAAPVTTLSGVSLPPVASVGAVVRHHPRSGFSE